MAQTPFDGTLVQISGPGYVETFRVQGFSGGKMIALGLEDGRIVTIDPGEVEIRLVPHVEKSMAALEREIADAKMVMRELLPVRSDAQLMRADTLTQLTRSFRQEFFEAVALRDQALARLRAAGITLEVKPALVEISPPS